MDIGIVLFVVALIANCIQAFVIWGQSEVLKIFSQRVVGKCYAGSAEIGLFQGENGKMYQFLAEGTWLKNESYLLLLDKKREAVVAAYHLEGWKEGANIPYIKK